jgi:hypothetical protein
MVYGSKSFSKRSRLLTRWNHTNEQRLKCYLYSRALQIFCSSNFKLNLIPSITMIRSPYMRIKDQTNKLLIAKAKLMKFKFKSRHIFLSLKKSQKRAQTKSHVATSTFNWHRETWARSNYLTTLKQFSQSIRISSYLHSPLQIRPYSGSTRQVRLRIDAKADLMSKEAAIQLRAAKKSSKKPIEDALLIIGVQALDTRS